VAQYPPQMRGLFASVKLSKVAQAFSSNRQKS
jgi:hypothetical protein